MYYSCSPAQIRLGVLSACKGCHFSLRARRKYTHSNLYYACLHARPAGCCARLQMNVSHFIQYSSVSFSRFSPSSFLSSTVTPLTPLPSASPVLPAHCSPRVPLHSPHPPLPHLLSTFVVANTSLSLLSVRACSSPAALSIFPLCPPPLYD